MSRSPFFFVERYNPDTNAYELEHPLVWNSDRTKRVIADLFPYNGCHDVFSIVEENSAEYPGMKGIHHGLPINVSEEIKKEFDECCYDISESFVHSPNARWFTYADMYIYCLEHPTVPDYEAMEENETEKTILKPTPLKALKDRVDAFLEVMDSWGWENDFSQIRIVYWIE
jgi:hypothetical protein